LRYVLLLASVSVLGSAFALAAAEQSHASLAITLQVTDARRAPATQQRSDAPAPVPLQVQALTPAAPPSAAAAAMVTVTY
jgi:hypothetical protein